MNENKHDSDNCMKFTANGKLAMIEVAGAKAPQRPFVYICSPFSGDVEGNTEKARQYCRYAIDNQYIPIAPHLYFPQFISDDDSAERCLALYINTQIIPKCAEVWVFGERITDGMSIEIEKAKQIHKPIRYFRGVPEEELR